ncbi:hypothetical protein [Thalassomonas haliotis]|uniref:Solute-binding protein family 3/N-terminal domain-containing protein n=1 Tax=Thalassomonas haliotis TaxID=485448 RepID=A0ABY7V7S0_9GAMM|nr:hypothetical protein [Thalassomonas haliotis]WDE09708.1 hypothetical protein H3N35_15405 [Thalassomonas haliotis]
MLPLFTKIRFILLLILILLPGTVTRAEEKTVTSGQQALNQPSPLQVRYYQRTLDAQLSDYESYWVGLLKLALEKSGRDFQLEPVSAKGVPHARLVSNLLNKGPVNIIFMGTNKEMEEKLLPIRIPLFRGLVGYRIMMTTTENAAVFADISSVTALKKAVIGLGLNWSDEPIMKEAGLNVVTLPYHRLFNALSGGRFHGISRGAHEIKGEYDIVKQSKTNLVIDKHLVLAYRLATFFFVAPDNQALADAITSGLEQAYRDGSFLTYFNRHPAVHNAIKLLTDPNRTWLWLDNHHLSQQTRDIPASYWFDPK